MRDNRGIDRDIPAISRKFAEVWEAINALRSERRASATTIPPGGTFTVELGGSLVLHLPTTSATANVNVDAVTGVLARSTSSRRYKQDIEDLDLDLAAILKMRPRTWRDKRDVAADPDRAPRYVGFVAEELHDAGLGMFVGYDAEGLPESVNYDRLTVALLICCRVLVNRITGVTGRATALESDAEGLKASVATLMTRANNLAARTTSLETKVADLTTRLETLEASATQPPPEPTP